MIKVEKLCFGYGEKQILNEISLNLEKGQLTGIVGSNGCGKTTLLKTILGLLPHSAGRITVDGRSIGEMKQSDVAKQIAYVPQGRGSVEMTVEQLVLHGRFPHLNYPRIYSGKDKQIALAAMRKVNVEPFANKKMSELSGGMRQNVYIAMALAQDTDFIFLDEPTTYLDVANQLQLMDVLKKLADDGKGIVAVMHDISLAFSVATRIAVMNEGKIVIADTPENVFLSGALSDVFGVDFNRIETEKGYTYFCEKLMNTGK